MARSMQKILLGDALTPASRAQLLQWLDANKTGGERIRAGLPADWKVGDKTGSGAERRDQRRGHPAAAGRARRPAGDLPHRMPGARTARNKHWRRWPEQPRRLGRSLGLHAARS